jgi:2-polyprenyl-3-methyl-5-hydroxy-6-metoxy-1,4-benzoquinol methylase
MNNQKEQWEKVRPQFDALPYPNQPLEATPQNDLDFLASSSLVIPYYLRLKTVVETSGKWILDAGCGSGFKLLALAMANPGAHIVGIDISPKSLDLAQKRLEYHGLENNVKFYCLPLEELPSLGHTFDYINCDEVLYLLADPTAGLRALQSVLKLQGIIRVNMHSSLQREKFYRMQEFFTRLGCLEGAPTPEEIALTRETMTALKDWVITKRQTWVPEYETDDGRLLANYLLRGDKGITMADFSAMLKQANLEFVSMVNWREWNLEALFKSVEDLPISIALGMAEMTLEEQLHLYELLHPCHRLLDLYCGHPGQGQSRPPVNEWPDDQWRTALVHLHPQLHTPDFKQLLEAAAMKLGMISLDQFLKPSQEKFLIDSSIATCLYPLFDHPQPLSHLLERWLQVRPVNLITLEPTNPDWAFQVMRNFLTDLEQAGYLLVEQC